MRRKRRGAVIDSLPFDSIPLCVQGEREVRALTGTLAHLNARNTVLREAFQRVVPASDEASTVRGLEAQVGKRRRAQRHLLPPLPSHPLPPPAAAAGARRAGCALPQAARARRGAD